MSSIIQRVSYKNEEAKPFLDKIAEHIGVHKLQIYLKKGDLIEGIVAEVGTDYVSLIEGGFDTIIPISSILYIRYGR